MGDERVWFCLPDEIGWLGAIVGFIAFGWVVYNQFFCFFDIMDDLRYNAGDFGLHVGIYSWPAAIVLGLIASFAEWDSVINWIIGILIVCQIIQIVIIVVDVGEKGGTAYGAFVSFVYLLGAISTIMILLQFILLLIVVAIILFLVCAFLSGASRSKSNSEDEGEYLIDKRGNRIEGRFISYDKFEGYNGKTYERYFNDDFVEKE
jgi:uncharacterized membrane protein